MLPLSIAPSNFSSRPGDTQAESPSRPAPTGRAPQLSDWEQLERAAPKERSEMIASMLAADKREALEKEISELRKKIEETRKEANALHAEIASMRAQGDLATGPHQARLDGLLQELDGLSEQLQDKTRRLARVKAGAMIASKGRPLKA